MKRTILIALVAVLTLFVACTPYAEQTRTGASLQDIDDRLTGPTTPEAGSEPVVVLAGTTTPLVEFTQEAYEQALAENKKIFLMWYATWCPNCRAEQKIAQPYFDSLNESDLIGFRVNFKDKETSVDEENLAREFGVSTQSTRIYIVDGQQVFKTPQHYLTIKDYQDNFQKYFGVTP